jgi:hypothetical protein
MLRYGSAPRWRVFFAGLVCFAMARPRGGGYSLRGWYALRLGLEVAEGDTRLRDVGGDAPVTGGGSGVFIGEARMQCYGSASRRRVFIGEARMQCYGSASRSPRATRACETSGATHLRQAAARGIHWRGSYALLWLGPEAAEGDTRLRDVGGDAPVTGGGSGVFIGEARGNAMARPRGGGYSLRG